MVAQLDTIKISAAQFGADSQKILFDLDGSKHYLRFGASQ